MNVRSSVLGLAFAALLAAAWFQRARGSGPDLRTSDPVARLDSDPSVPRLSEPPVAGRVDVLPEVAAPPLEVAALAARLRSFAEHELAALSAGAVRPEVQAELERLLAPTLQRPEELTEILAHLVARTWSEDDGSRPSTTEFGGIRFLYWGLLLRHSPGSPIADAAAGRELFVALVTALPDLPQGTRGPLLDQVLTLRIDGRSLVGLYLADVLALRARFAEHKSVFSALLAVLEEELSPGDKDALFGLLLVDEGDPVLVATSLKNLLQGHRPDLALALAEQLFDGATSTQALRVAVALTVVQGSQDPFAAAEFLEQRSDALRNSPHVWMTLGQAEGGIVALEARYQQLLELGADPQARRLLVAGMFGAAGADLENVRRKTFEDSDPGVRGQAWLTWTSSPDYRPAPADLVELRMALDGGLPVFDTIVATRNIARRASGDLRQGAAGLLSELVLDESVSLRNRRAAFEGLRGLVSDAQLGVLEKALSLAEAQD